MPNNFLGIDCGSVSMKAVIIDGENKIVDSVYTKNKGLVQTSKEIMYNLKGNKDIRGVGVTGSGKDLVSLLVGADTTESEIISHYVATTTKIPKVRTIFDIGGEDSKIMAVTEGVLTYFNMNQDCGGGTGAMIESIAQRMNVKLDDIGDLALSSKTRVSIPSKCGIFAQSAVVSKLNKGVPHADILMGVCRGLIGNYFTMLAKGVKLSSPYVFQGATAKNRALVKCFEDEVGEKIIIPEQPELMGAYGMALLSKENRPAQTKFKGFNLEDVKFETKTYYGTKCQNTCEITQIYEDSGVIGTIGNRCDKCLKNK